MSVVTGMRWAPAAINRSMLPGSRASMASAPPACSQWIWAAWGTPVRGSGPAGNSWASRISTESTCSLTAAAASMPARLPPMMTTRLGAWLVARLMAGCLLRGRDGAHGRSGPRAKRAPGTAEPSPRRATPMSKWRLAGTRYASTAARERPGSWSHPRRPPRKNHPSTCVRGGGRRLPPRTAGPPRPVAGRGGDRCSVREGAGRGRVSAAPSRRKRRSSSSPRRTRCSSSP